MVWLRGEAIAADLTTGVPLASVFQLVKCFPVQVGSRSEMREGNAVKSWADVMIQSSDFSLRRKRANTTILNSSWPNSNP